MIFSTNLKDFPLDTSGKEDVRGITDQNIDIKKVCHSFSQFNDVFVVSCRFVNSTVNLLYFFNRELVHLTFLKANCYRFGENLSPNRIIDVLVFANVASHLIQGYLFILYKANSIHVTVRNILWTWQYYNVVIYSPI